MFSHKQSFSPHRRLLLWGCCFILVLLCAMPAWAVDLDGPQREAIALQQLGIFQGRDGGFALDQRPNRAEACTVLVRMLGKEKEALAQKQISPFRDVPAWASPYVGWLYQHGLVQGQGDGTFGNTAINAPEMLTLLLRSLGYDDSQGDFDWKNAVTFSQQRNIITPQRQTEITSGNFTRQDLALSLFDFLQATPKGGKQTLLAQLIQQGAISSQQVQATGLIDLLAAAGLTQVTYDRYAIVQNYHFQVEKPENSLVMTVTLPGGYLNRQQVISHQYSHPPQKVYQDGGVTYADFKFDNLSANLDLKITTRLRSNAYDLDTAQWLTNGAPLTNQEKAVYLKEEGKIDVSNSAIQQAAATISGVDQNDLARNIYHYVLDTMTPEDTPDLYTASQALGRKRGDCEDYSLLMTALCRAKGIPARIALGFMRTTTDTAHAWVEVYLDDYGWVPMDPVNGDGGLAYGDLPNQYVYFTTRYPDPVMKGDVFFTGGFYGGQFSYDFQFSQ